MQNSKLMTQIIFITSLIATLGSLYFSEIRGYLPCELCWYQRILMYPIIIISLSHILSNSKSLIYPTAILSCLGILVSSYHYALQNIPGLSGSHECKIGDCTVQFIQWGGFITIPFLALIAFIIIFVSSIIYIKGAKHNG